MQRYPHLIHAQDTIRDHFKQLGVKEAFDILIAGLTVLETVQGENLSVEFPRLLQGRIGLTIPNMVDMANLYGMNVRTKFDGTNLLVTPTTYPPVFIAQYFLAKSKAEKEAAAAKPQVE
jgi:hypothetical protein